MAEVEEDMRQSSLMNSGRNCLNLKGDNEQIGVLPIVFDLKGKPYDYQEFLVLVPKKHAFGRAVREICADHKFKKQKTRKRRFLVRNTVNETNTPRGYVVDKETFDLFTCCARDLVFGFRIKTVKEKNRLKEQVYLVDGPKSPEMLIS